MKESLQLIDTKFDLYASGYRSFETLDKEFREKVKEKARSGRREGWRFVIVLMDDLDEKKMRYFCLASATYWSYVSAGGPDFAFAGTGGLYADYLLLEKQAYAKKYFQQALGLHGLTHYCRDDAIRLVMGRLHNKMHPTVIFFDKKEWTRDLVDIMSSRHPDFPFAYVLVSTDSIINL